MKKLFENFRRSINEWKPGDKKFFSTSEEAREYARDVERVREQGIDPDKARQIRTGVGMVDPFAKYREEEEANKKATARADRRKLRADLRKADQAEAPMTPADAPVSIDRAMLDAPDAGDYEALQEEEGLILDPAIHNALVIHVRKLEQKKEREREEERKRKQAAQTASDNKEALRLARLNENYKITIKTNR